MFVFISSYITALVTFQSSEMFLVYLYYLTGIIQKFIRNNPSLTVYDASYCNFKLRNCYKGAVRKKCCVL